MKHINLDRAWRFSRTRAFFGPGNAEPETVNLPHDYSISQDTDPKAPGGGPNGYYPGGTGFYEKDLDIPAEYAGKRVMLAIGGAYMDACVALNRQTVCHHHYGYTAFHADLTPYMKPGQKNRLAISCVNNQPNSRWYSGSGLYRSVELLVGEPVHIIPWGVFARVDHIVGKDAFLEVEVTVANDTAAARTVQAVVYVEKDGERKGEGRKRCFLPAGEKTITRVKVAVYDFDAWDIDDPQLYTVRVVLAEKEKKWDEETVSYGIRTVTADAKYGLRLNDRTIKIKGGCIHHDNGLLGAVSLKESEYRRLKALKENGYNAVRFAHNPPSGELLQVCDELGLLAMDEAFDCWAVGKNINDYAGDFAECWQADIEAMVLQARNHPCVIFWSTGNEIAERNGSSNGYRLSCLLAEKIRKLDPTRLICNGINAIVDVPDDDALNQKLMEEHREAAKNANSFILQNAELPTASTVWGEYTECFASPLDVVGYNYLENRYERERTEFPDRVVVGTESFPERIDLIWDLVERLPHVIGDFTWAACEYLGEAGIGAVSYVDPGEKDFAAGMGYPMRLSHCSDFDLLNDPRPQLSYRRIVWGSEETFIAAHDPKNYGKKEQGTPWSWPDCVHGWNFAGWEGKRTRVDVYSAGETVELILNGRSLGQKPAGRAARFRASFDIPYEAGKLEAVSYRRGEILSRDFVETTGMPESVRVTLNRTILPADGHAVLFADIAIVDHQGRVVPSAEIPCEAIVTGPARLAGFGSAKPDTKENYTSGRFTSWNGRLLAVIRAGYESGPCTLTIRAAGMPETQRTFVLQDC